MLKNFLMLIAGLLLTLQTTAQDSELKIKASDPTLLYTQIQASGGIHFIDNAPEYWQFNLGGTWAIKKKFSLSIQAPISNNAFGPSLFENLRLDAAYQIHHNPGFFKSSLVCLGITTPATDDYYLRFIRDPYSSSYAFRASYTAGLGVSEKLSLYPKLEYYRRFGEVRVGQYNPSTGEVEYSPKLSHQGFRIGVTLSYDFYEKNFLQLGLSYAQGSWQEELGFDELFSVHDNTFQSLDLRLRYQYAIRPQSQIFLEVYQQFRTVVPRRVDGRYNQNKAGFSLGYRYFLD